MAYLKTILVLVVALTVVRHSAGAQQPSAEEVVSQCAAAMGVGIDVDDVKALRIQYFLPDHGAPVWYDFGRPSLLKHENLAYDGKRGAFRTEDGWKLDDPEVWAHYEIDVAFFLPAFFDYPATYEGVDTIVGIRSHRLGVSLPGGSQVTYYIDSETYLIVKVVSDATVHGESQHMERLFTNYEESDGLLFPRAFTYPGRRSGILTGTVLDVVVNPPLEPGHFDLPPEVGG